MHNILYRYWIESKFYSVFTPIHPVWSQIWNFYFSSTSKFQDLKSELKTYPNNFFCKILDFEEIDSKGGWGFDIDSFANLPE